MAATMNYPALVQSATMAHGRGSESAHRRRAMPRTAACRDRSADLISAATLERLGRVAYAVLLLGVVLAIVIVSVVGTEHPQPAAWTAVTVQQSGTLWALARAYPVAGLTTAETVDLIQRSNQLDSALITPGQALRVPAPDNGAMAVVSR